VSTQTQKARYFGLELLQRQGLGETDVRSMLLHPIVAFFIKVRGKDNDFDVTG
jgi:hypothetical protein